MPGNVNDKTSAFSNAYPERLIGFMSLHPHDPHALDDLERARGDLGLRGIKMGVNYQNFHTPWSRAHWRSMSGRKRSACQSSFIKTLHPFDPRRFVMRTPFSWTSSLCAILISESSWRIWAIPGRLNIAEDVLNQMIRERGLR